MVSTVEGELRDGVGLAEILEATFPGGSVTGAPKIAAVDLIAELEPVGRGASMGAPDGVRQRRLRSLAHHSTFAVAGGTIHLWVGGGVVWDPIRRPELEESWTKARPLLEAIGSRMPEPVASREHFSRWRRPGAGSSIRTKLSSGPTTRRCCADGRPSRP